MPIKYLFVFFLISPLHAFCQGSGILIIRSTLDTPDLNCEHVVLEIENLSRHETKVTRCGELPAEVKKWHLNASRKEFIVSLALNNQYKIRYSTKGFSSTVLLMDTRVPSDGSQDIIYEHTYKIKLFPIPDSSNHASNEKIVSMFSFSSTTSDFAFSKDSIKIASFYYSLGLNESERNNYDYAIEYFSQTLKFVPNDIPALMHRGTAKVKKKDMEGACKDWMQVKNAGSGDADIYLQNYCNQSQK